MPGRMPSGAETAVFPVPIRPRENLASRREASVSWMGPGSDPRAGSARSRSRADRPTRLAVAVHGRPHESVQHSPAVRGLPMSPRSRSGSGRRVVKSSKPAAWCPTVQSRPRAGKPGSPGFAGGRHTTCIRIRAVEKSSRRRRKSVNFVPAAAQTAFPRRNPSLPWPPRPVGRSVRFSIFHRAAASGRITPHARRSLPRPRIAGRPDVGGRSVSTNACSGRQSGGSDALPPLRCDPCRPVSSDHRRIVRRLDGKHTHRPAHASAWAT